MNARRWPDRMRSSPGYQRHHLIPLGLLSRPQFGRFFSVLTADGVRLTRFADNGLVLPATEALAAATGFALHRGPHPAYSDIVAARIEAIRATTRLDCRRARWSASHRIMILQSALRRALTDRHRQGFWLNRRDPMRLFADRPYLDEAIMALFDDD